MADTLKFTEDHLWIRVEGKRAQIGISDYGQSELGRSSRSRCRTSATRWRRASPSARSSPSDGLRLISPLSGAVTAINTEIEEHPRIVNEDPLHEGWLLESSSRTRPSSRT